MPNVLADLPALEAIAAPLCTAQGLELVCLQFGHEPEGAVLRVLIELPKAETLPKGVGVTLEDCTRVSRELSAKLDDHEDLVEGKYRLEVSSAGVERPLVKPLDFERYVGREVKLSTKKPIEERKTFTGTLLGLRDQSVLLQLGAGPNQGEELAIPLPVIAKANLVFRF
jgi:ribosome maturation factor RimP